MKNAAGLVLLLAAAAAARGQETAPGAGPPMTLGISPLRAELKIGPGVDTTQAVRISNTGQVPTQIRATISDWSLTRSGEMQFLRAGTGNWGCGGWLRVNPGEFALSPGGVALVRYTMGVPASAREGGYHCAIVFDTLPPPKQQLGATTGVVNLVRMVTTLYATVGNPPIVARVVRLEIVPRKGGRKPSYEIVTEFGNDGTTQYRVTGDLELLDAEGKVIRKFEYKSFPVLPGVPREAVFPLDEALAPGSYRLRAVIDVGSKERLGAETRIAVAGS